MSGNRKGRPDQATPRQAAANNRYPNSSTLIDLEQYVADAAELARVMRNPKALLGYDEGELIACSRWSRPAIVWERDQIRSAIPPCIVDGPERWDRQQLTQAELLEIAEYLLWIGATEDARNREIERDRRASGRRRVAV